MVVPAGESGFQKPYLLTKQNGEIIQ